MTESKWLSIESAPKDGTQILIFRNQRCAIGRFNEDKYIKTPSPYWDGTDARLWGKNWAKKIAPTHWMPLPSPPSSDPETYQ